MNATVQKTKDVLTGAAQWVWSEKPYIVFAVSATVAAMQLSGYAVPPWLAVTCTLLGGSCYAGLHYATKPR